MPQHIIWDWNGTLLDDLEMVVHAVDVTVRSLGGPPVSVTDYQTHFTRPVRLMYEHFIERPIGEEEWAGIDADFHDVYNDQLAASAYNGDGRAVLEDVARRGATQSLLSMYAHGDLVDVVRRFELNHHFTHIQGRGSGPPGGRKAAHLARHLAILAAAGIEAGSTVMIGDTPDDAHAAQANEIRVVIYDGGSHHRTVLDDLGLPVADTLHHAIELAL